jgi:hypothetical protein
MSPLKDDAPCPGRSIHIKEVPRSSSDRASHICEDSKKPCINTQDGFPDPIILYANKNQAFIKSSISSAARGISDIKFKGAPLS